MAKVDASRFILSSSMGVQSFISMKQHETAIQQQFPTLKGELKWLYTPVPQHVNK